MRKLFMMALAISVFMTMGASSAFATGNGGGGNGNGKPCNPNSPAGQAGSPHHPGCNDPGGGNGGGGGGDKDTCNDGKDNDKDGPKDAKDPECLDPNDGVEDGKGGDGGPEVCENADVPLLSADALLLCLYLPGNEADKEAECPDPLILLEGTGPLEGGAICALPSTSGGGGPALPELPLP